jgi:predicted dehydrogenase
VPSFRNAIVAGVTLLLAAPAVAQTTVGQASGQRQESPVRIQTTFNFFVPGPSGEGEEAQKSRDKARHIVYEMAAHECDLLREVLAKDCRMEAVSSNVGRQFGQQQPEGYTVNGSVSLQITLK